MNFRALFILFIPCCTVLKGQDCNWTYDTDYTSVSGWTYVGSPGNVSITGGVLLYNDVYGPGYNKIIRNLPATLSNEHWSAQCSLKAIGGSGPGHHIMAFTAGTGDPISSDAADGYSLTANDAIMVYLNYTDTPSSPYCCPDPAGGKWQLFARAKKGTILGPPSTGISITALDEKYYVRLERITASQVMLSVFSDPAYTIHLPGSPLNYTIDCSIQGLNTIQQGVITWAGWYRHLTCELDDLHICSADSATSPPVQAVTGCPGENVGLSVVTSPGDIVSWDSPDVSCTNCASVTVPVPGSGSSLYCAQIDNGSCAPVINCFTVTAQPCDSSSTDHPLTSHPLIDPLLNDSVHIDSIFIQPECEMAVVPNIITPNGDGLNDFFRPLNCPVNQMQLAIYNRWGLKVFETSDPVAKWEGKTSSGNHCNDGVYYYLLGYITPNGSGVTRNGFIQLSR